MAVVKTGSIEEDFGTIELPLEITKKSGDKVNVTLELPEALNVGQSKALQSVQDVMGEMEEGIELEGANLETIQKTFCALVTDWSWTNPINIESLNGVGLEGFIEMLTPVMNHYGFGVEIEEDEENLNDPNSSGLLELNSGSGTGTANPQ